MLVEDLPYFHGWLLLLTIKLTIINAHRHQYFSSSFRDYSDLNRWGCVGFDLNLQIKFPNDYGKK